MAGLIEKAADPKHLLASYLRIREKYYDDILQAYGRYASGIDGEDLKDFDLHLDDRLEDCRRFLLEGRNFDPQILRKVPKDTPGEYREVFLLTLRDKVVQKAMADALSPLLEKIYAPNLYSYRPSGRFGTLAAAVGVLNYLKEHGHKVHAFKTDVSDYSDHMRHDLLREKFSKLMPKEKRFLEWLESFLHQPKLVRGALHSPIVGIPSGSPLTPLFNNLYLSDLDDAMFRRGEFYRRFGDDILLLSTDPERLEDAVAKLRASLAEHGLPLSEDKTRLIGPGEAFDYLGYRFEKDAVLVASKTLAKYRDWIRSELSKARYARYARGTRDARRRLLRKIVADLNTATERGIFQLPWIKTFPLLSDDRDLRQMDLFIKDRIRLCILGRPSKRSHQDIPESWFRELGYKSLSGAYYRISRRRPLGPYRGWRLYYGTNFEREKENHPVLSPLKRAWKRLTERVRFVRTSLEGSTISDTPANS